MGTELTTSTVTKACGSKAHELFSLASKRKLSDIFSNGFSVPDNIKTLVQQTAIPKTTNIKNIKSKDILSLFDIVLLAISEPNDSFFYDAKENSNTWYVVFKDNAKIGKNSYPIGFTQIPPEYTGIEEQGRAIYSISLKSSLDFCFAKSRIDRYLASVNLMFQKAINSNKNILKSDLTKITTNSSDPKLIKSMMQKVTNMLTRKQTQLPDSTIESNEKDPVDELIKEMKPNTEKQIQEIANSNISSILNIPLGYDLTFPTGDLTQLQIFYKSMQEELGAVLQMPLTKLFGTPPTGFQSTGEYDRLSYEQTLDSIANTYCVSILKEVASMLKHPQSEIDKIKYLSTYQLELTMKIVNMTAGLENTQIKKMVANYIEIKTGIPPEPSDLEEKVPAPTTTDLSEEIDVNSETEII